MKSNKSRKGYMTAAEFGAELERDPEWVAMMDRKEEERRRLSEASARNAAPVLADLAAAGFPVESVADLFNLKINYKRAIPVLLSWLPKVSDPAVKEDIIRAVSVEWARPAAARLLIREFDKPENATDASLLWAIGNALAVVADDSVFNEIVRLITDRRLGKAREMLALALGNMKDPRASQILVDLLQDEEVAGHAVMALGNVKAKHARPAVERLLTHPKEWVRKEARKALARMES